MWNTPLTRAGAATNKTIGWIVMGGQSGAVGHIKIGTGAQIAGGAHPKNDVPAGARMGGTPAVPMLEYGRQVAALRRLGKRGGRSGE